MKNNSIKYQIATKKDINGLSKLFYEVYGKEFSLKYLNWLYFENPFQDRVYNCVAKDYNGKIIGHSAFQKNFFKIKNKIYTGGLTLGSAVLKDYGGHFVPIYLFLERNYVNKFDFFYGFPNNKSFPFFVKIFEYKEIFFELLSKSVSSEKDWSDQKYIWESLKVNNYDSRFLKWRLSNNPINNYFYFEVNNLKVVWKFYLKNKIDVVLVLSKNVNLNIEKRFPPLKTTNLNTMIFSNDIKAYFTKNKFKINSSSNSLIIKIINPQIDFNLLRFSMLDIDIF